VYLTILKTRQKFIVTQQPILRRNSFFNRKLLRKVPWAHFFDEQQRQQQKNTLKVDEAEMNMPSQRMISPR